MLACPVSSGGAPEALAISYLPLTSLQCVFHHCIIAPCVSSLHCNVSYIIAMCVSSFHLVCFIIAICVSSLQIVLHPCTLCFIIAMCVSSLHWLLHHYTVCFIIALILPILIIIIMTMEAPSMACAENSQFVRETTQSVSKRSDI